jgi:hypothetical protein
MVILVNDPKRTQIDLSMPLSAAEKIEACMRAHGLQFGLAADEDRRFFLDIKGSPAQMSSLVKNLEENDWDRPDKVYILVKARKGGKAHEHGAETRRKAGKGSQGGDSEGADSPAGHGAADRVGGSDPADRDSGAESDPWPAEIVSGSDDDCD